jgi:opacity protein-like surface antigen
MKKMILVFCALVLSLALIYSPAQAQVKLGFKVAGGVAYVGGGDINAGLKGYSDFYNDLYSPVYNTSGGYSPFHWGMDILAEIQLKFSPNFTLALGSGYISATKSSQLNIPYGATAYQEKWAPSVSAIPVTLTFYYFLPMGNSARVFFDAGAGYYFGKYTDTWHIVFLGEADANWDLSGGSGLGFHGGAGLEIDLAPNIALLVEVRGRYASLSGFNGTEKIGSSTYTGDLYYYEGNLLGVGVYPLIDVGTEMPSGTGISNARKAKLDLSGFCAVAGFVIHF